MKTRQPDKIEIDVRHLPMQVDILDAYGNAVSYLLRPAGKKLGACLNKLEYPAPRNNR